MDGVLKPSGAAPAVRLHVSAVPEDACVQHVPTTGTAASAMVKRRDGMSMLGSGYHKLQQARLMAVVAKVEEMEREQNLRPGLQVTSAILLLAVPVCSAFTGVGLTVGSAEGTGFFRMTPMIVGSMTLSVGLVAWICLRYGAAELRQLFTWQYLLAGLAIGGPNAMLFTAQNLAIKTISPSLFFVIKKTNLIWAAVFEALNLRLWPERMKVATIVTLLLACSGYIFKTMADEKREGGDGGPEPEAPIEGYVLAFLAAVLSALGGASTGIANASLGEGREGRARDVVKLRLHLADQLVKVPFYSAWLFATEGADVLERGFFAGWNTVIALVTMPPFIVSTPVFNMAVFACGNLTANIAMGFDIGVSYTAEVLLGFDELSATNAIMISTVGAILVMSSIHKHDSDRGLFEQKKEIIRSMRNRLSSTLTK